MESHKPHEREPLARQETNRSGLTRTTNVQCSTVTGALKPGADLTALVCAPYVSTSVQRVRLQTMRCLAPVQPNPTVQPSNPSPTQASKELRLACSSVVAFLSPWGKGHRHVAAALPCVGRALPSTPRPCFVHLIAGFKAPRRSPCDRHRMSTSPTCRVLPLLLPACVVPAVCGLRSAVCCRPSPPPLHASPLCSPRLCHGSLHPRTCKVRFHDIRSGLALYEVLSDRALSNTEPLVLRSG
jgi:hypothetical protein